MSFSLGVTISIIAVSIGVYLIFLLRRYRQIQYREGASISDIGMGSDKVISESPLYHETKESVKDLRSELDRFVEIVDTISAKEQVASKEEINTAYKEGIPKMHTILISARNKAGELLALVDKSPQKKAAQIDIFGSSHHAPSRSPSNSRSSARVDRLHAALLDIINGISPIIAGFYFTLIERDERSQTMQAAAHIEQIISQLDQAIQKMIALEKELADK